jgi:hypothetical protein
MGSEPRIDRQVAGSGIQDPATQARPASSASSAIATEAAAAEATDSAVATIASPAESSTTTEAAETTVGLVIRKVHGDTRESRGTSVEETSAATDSGSASASASPAITESAVATGTKRSTLATASAERCATAAAGAATAAVGRIQREEASCWRIRWALRFERDDTASCVERAPSGPVAAEPAVSASADVKFAGESSVPTIAER